MQFYKMKIPLSIPLWIPLSTCHSGRMPADCRNSCTVAIAPLSVSDRFCIFFRYKVATSASQDSQKATAGTEATESYRRSSATNSGFSRCLRMLRARIWATLTGTALPIWRMDSVHDPRIS